MTLSFYRVRKTDGEAYIASIDYIRKMAYHFAASAGQETAFLRLLRAQGKITAGHTISKLGLSDGPHCGHLF